MKQKKSQCNKNDTSLKCGMQVFRIGGTSSRTQGQFQPQLDWMETDVGFEEEEFPIVTT